MPVHEWKRIAMTLLLLGSIATGAGDLTRARAMKDEPQKAASALQSSDPKSEIENPKSGRMFVVGRVLDPDGKPVPGATIAAYARGVGPGLVPNRFLRGPIPIGDARADGSGRFRIDAPRTSSSAPAMTLAPSPWRPAMVPAGSISIPTTTSPTPTSPSDRSK